MNGWNYEPPRAEKAGVPERAFVSICCVTCGTHHDLHKYRKPVMCHIRCTNFNICDTELPNVCIRYAWRSWNFQQVVWSFCEEYPWLNNFETIIDPLKSLNFLKTRAYRILYSSIPLSASSQASLLSLSPLRSTSSILKPYELVLSDLVTAGWLPEHPGMALFTFRRHTVLVCDDVHIAEDARCIDVSDNWGSFIPGRKRPYLVHSFAVSGDMLWQGVVPRLVVTGREDILVLYQTSC